MKQTRYKFLQPAAVVAAAGLLLTACNKDLPEATPIVPVNTTGLSLLRTIRSDANYSILDSAIKKAGSSTIALLSDSTAGYTVFAPDNAAFATIGVTGFAQLAGFSSTQLQSILAYHLVPGVKLYDSINVVKSPGIPQNFPNIQLPTAMVLAAPSPALPPGLRNSVFVSRRGTNAWVNQIPIVGAPVEAGNSLIYKIGSVLVPPSTTVKGILRSDTTFNLFNAAIARADSGQVAGLSVLDSLMNYTVANMTVFAPNNAAFRALFPPGTPDAAIIATLNNPAVFPVQTVRAIVAYHIAPTLPTTTASGTTYTPTRAFSVNFPATPTPFNSLLTIPPATNVPVVVSFTPGASGVFQVKGLANASFSTVVTRDRTAINGVVHVINQVLRPQ